MAYRQLTNGLGRLGLTPRQISARMQPLTRVVQQDPVTRPFWSPPVSDRYLPTKPVIRPVEVSAAGPMVIDKTEVRSAVKRVFRTSVGAAGDRYDWRTGRQRPFVDPEIVTAPDGTPTTLNPSSVTGRVILPTRRPYSPPVATMPRRYIDQPPAIPVLPFVPSDPAPGPAVPMALNTPFVGPLRPVSIYDAIEQTQVTASPAVDPEGIPLVTDVIAAGTTPGWAKFALAGVALFIFLQSGKKAARR